MRRLLTAFALVVAVSVCGGLKASAQGARPAKSPLGALAEKVAEVSLAGGATESQRAALPESLEKVSAAAREGDFCGAARRLEIFKFHVGRFTRLRVFERASSGRELSSLADLAARRFRERAGEYGLDCPAPE